MRRCSPSLPFDRRASTRSSNVSLTSFALAALALNPSSSGESSAASRALSDAARAASSFSWRYALPAACITVPSPATVRVPEPVRPNTPRVNSLTCDSLHAATRAESEIVLSPNGPGLSPRSPTCIPDSPAPGAPTPAAMSPPALPDRAPIPASSAANTGDVPQGGNPIPGPKRYRCRQATWSSHKRLVYLRSREGVLLPIRRRG